jgi:hypothetical protein
MEAFTPQIEKAFGTVYLRTVCSPSVTDTFEVQTILKQVRNKFRHTCIL